jgi:hypothetical protein
MALMWRKPQVLQAGTTVLLLVLGLDYDDVLLSTQNYKGWTQRGNDTD